MELFTNFNVLTAQRYANEGRLEEWIYSYLKTGEWANLGLLEGLQRQQRWWIGPIEVELNLLKRACGPEPGMEYRESEAAWDAHVTRIGQNLSAPLDTSPLIVMYETGELSIRDGNHRHEAMRRKGWRNCWIVLWHNSLQDFIESKTRLRWVVAE